MAWSRRSPSCRFGGVQDGGYGHELSAYGIRAFWIVKGGVRVGGPDLSTSCAG